MGNGVPVGIFDKQAGVRGLEVTDRAAVWIQQGTDGLEMAYQAL